MLVTLNLELLSKCACKRLRPKWSLRVSTQIFHFQVDGHNFDPSRWHGTATAERSFSQMKLVKTRLRGRLSDSVLLLKAQNYQHWTLHRQPNGFECNLKKNCTQTHVVTYVLNFEFALKIVMKFKNSGGVGGGGLGGWREIPVPPPPPLYETLILYNVHMSYISQAR